MIAETKLAADSLGASVRDAAHSLSQFGPCEVDARERK
jgi:hypothetical protein